MPVSNQELFPPFDRVIYDRAPLVHVICQVKFPPVLRIESQPPADFQDQIRQEFPLYERVSDPLLRNIPSDLSHLFGSQATLTTFRFATADSTSVVVLAQDSLSLTTTRYRHWGEFRKQFELPFRALTELYKPSFFLRVGLRYANAIQRESLGLSGEKWSALLSSEILGELANPLFEDNLVEARRVLRINMPDGSGGILLQHGLAEVSGATEQAYLIDCDFYTESIAEGAHVGTILDGFNRISGRAFRWCITDKLSVALGPRPFEPLAEHGA